MLSLRLRTFPALLIALAATAPATAQEPRQPGGKALGFAVEPLNSPGAIFDFRAAAGDRIRGTLLVRNTGSDTVTLVLRPQDASTAMTGGLQYEDPAPDGVGSWIELGEAAVELPPGAAKQVSVTARVPAGARPGDHLAGIVAYDRTELARVRRERGAHGRVSLSFISRFAVAVRIRVPGPARAELAPGEVGIESTPSGAAIIVGIRNTGGLLIPSSKGRITVTRDGRKLLRQPIELTAFVPGTEIAYPLPWQGAPSEGTYHVEGFLHPSKGKAIVFDRDVTFGEDESRDLKAQTGLEAEGGGVAWWVWALLGALAATALAFAVLAYRRRERRPVTDAEPSPAPVPIAIPETAPRSAPAGTGRAIRESNGGVDLNGATVDQLLALPGVGRAAARRIVAYRDEYGDFETVGDLAQVDGFDGARIRRLSGHTFT